MKHNASSLTGISRNRRRIPNASRNAGFTLIELLVVIAIIALLVSILMPSLNQARDYAKRVKCLSNLRGCGVAIQYYQADFEGFMPAVYQGLSGNPYGPADSTKTWYYDIASYAGTDGVNYAGNPDKETIFYCSEHPKRTAQNYGRISYGPNMTILLDLANDWSIPRTCWTFLKSDSVENTAAKIQLGEKNLDTDYAWVRFDDTCDPDNPLNLDTIARCHMDATNVLMYDGHSESPKDPFELELWELN